MKNHISKAYEDLLQLREQLQQKTMIHWKQQNMFTWEWWLLLGLTIFPLIIWWKVVDRKRAYEIAFYGCMINIFALILDDIGTSLMWWGYPIKLEPFVPPLVTADSVLVPVILMLVYQRFSSTWKSFIISIIISGAFIAFVAEPIFVWIGFYQPLKWSFIYSYLFYIISSFIARLIIIRIVK